MWRYSVVAWCMVCGMAGNGFASTPPYPICNMDVNKDSVEVGKKFEAHLACQNSGDNFKGHLTMTCSFEPLKSASPVVDTSWDGPGSGDIYVSGDTIWCSNGKECNAEYLVFEGEDFGEIDGGDFSYTDTYDLEVEIKAPSGTSEIKVLCRAAICEMDWENSKPCSRWPLSGTKDQQGWYAKKMTVQVKDDDAAADGSSEPPTTPPPCPTDEACDGKKVVLQDCNFKTVKTLEDCGTKAVSKTSLGLSCNGNTVVETFQEKPWSCGTLPNSYKGCVQSTSAYSAPLETCAYGCSNGACTSNPKAYKACKGNEVWWYNAEDKPTEFVTSCYKVTGSTNYFCDGNVVMKAVETDIGTCEEGACSVTKVKDTKYEKTCVGAHAISSSYLCNGDEIVLEKTMKDEYCMGGTCHTAPMPTITQVIKTCDTSKKKVKSGTQTCSGNDLVKTDIMSDETCVQGKCVPQSSTQTTVLQTCPYGCAGSVCSAPPSCQITDAGWEQTYAHDGETVGLFVAHNGFCASKVFTITIYDEDLFSKDDQIDTFAVSGAGSMYDWNAQYVNDAASLMDFCIGPGCIFLPEYYFTITDGSKMLFSSESKPRLTVIPFFAGLTLDEYLEEIRQLIEDAEAEAKDVAFTQCATFSGTITSRCRELIASANVEPLSEEIIDAWQGIVGWWNKGLNFFDPGYIVVVGISCVACGSASGGGALFFEPMSSQSVGDLLDGGIYDEEFQYPFSVIGPGSCELCTGGIMDALDNAQLAAFDFAQVVSKMLFLAASKIVVKKAGVSSFTHFLDDAGRGARATYNLGDTVYDHHFVFIEDAGLVKISQTAYKDPIWFTAGGKEFVLFNALHSGPIVEVTSLSKESKALFAGIFQDDAFQAFYKNAETYSAPALFNKFSKLKFKPIQEMPSEGGKWIKARFIPVTNTIELNIAFPAEQWYAGMITAPEFLLAVPEHEMGHFAQLYGLQSKGYTITATSKQNHAVEFMADYFGFTYGNGKDVFAKLLRASLKKTQNDVGFESLIAGYKLAILTGDKFVRYRLVSFNAVAKLVDEDVVKALGEQMALYYPEGKTLLDDDTKALLKAADVFNAELLSPLKASKEFNDAIQTYHLDWWSQSGWQRRFFEESDVVLEENASSESGDDVQLQSASASEHTPDEGNENTEGSAELVTILGDLHEIVSGCKGRVNQLIFLKDEESIASCYIDFGDGTKVPCEVEQAQGYYYEIGGSHVYSTNGTHAVALQVITTDGDIHVALGAMETYGCIDSTVPTSEAVGSALDAPLPIGAPKVLRSGCTVKVVALATHPCRPEFSHEVGEQRLRTELQSENLYTCVVEFTAYVSGEVELYGQTENGSAAFATIPFDVPEHCLEDCEAGCLFSECEENSPVRKNSVSPLALLGGLAFLWFALRRKKVL